MALFRTDYSGRGELSERQQKVCQNRFIDPWSSAEDPLARTAAVQADEVGGRV